MSVSLKRQRTSPTLLALFDQGARERRTVAASRIGYDDFGAVQRMTIDQVGKQVDVVALVEDVAADQQVETSKFDIGYRPVQMPVGDLRQIVQSCIVVEERLRERVMVAGRDIGVAPLQDEARKTGVRSPISRMRLPTTSKPHIGFGEHPAGRPDVAEQAPLRQEMPIRSATPCGSANCCRSLRARTRKSWPPSGMTRSRVW